MKLPQSRYRPTIVLKILKCHSDDIHRQALWKFPSMLRVLSLIDLLTKTFQKEAAQGKLRAAGICYDVLTVPPGEHQKQDAICCGLEHCLGEAVNVFKPYFKTEDGKFQYDEIFAANRTPQFFCQIPRV